MEVDLQWKTTVKRKWSTREVDDLQWKTTSKGRKHGLYTGCKFTLIMYSGKSKHVQIFFNMCIFGDLDTSRYFLTNVFMEAFITKASKSISDQQPGSSSSMCKERQEHWESILDRPFQFKPKTFQTSQQSAINNGKPFTTACSTKFHS